MSRMPPVAIRLVHRLRAIAVSSVQVPGGRSIHGSSNAGIGEGIVVCPAELERRAQRVSERQPQDAADDRCVASPRIIEEPTRRGPW